jgi:hypothetical protein
MANLPTWFNILGSSWSLPSVGAEGALTIFTHIRPGWNLERLATDKNLFGYFVVTTLFLFVTDEKVE